MVCHANFITERNKKASYTLIAATAGLWRLGAHDNAEAILRKYQGGELASEWLLHLYKTRQTKLLQQLNVRRLFAQFIFEFYWFGSVSSDQSLILHYLFDEQFPFLALWPD